MTEHKGVTQDHGILGGCPVGAQWPLWLPSPRQTLNTHLARRADLPWEAWGARESRAARSSTVTLGAIVALWMIQPASGT